MVQRAVGEEALAPPGSRVRLRTTRNALIALAALMGTAAAVFYAMRESDQDILDRLIQTHTAYIKYERPERGRMFVSLVDALSSQVERSGGMRKSQLIRWLGTPDDEWEQVDEEDRSTGKTALVYFYRINGEEGQAFFAFLDGKAGIVRRITVAQVPRNTHQ